MERRRVLIIYTGGTIGMVEEPSTKTLKPFNFDELSRQVPELNKLNFDLETIVVEPIIDSSNMNPEIWISLGHVIQENYHQFDGFVILHGSDTMAYTASGLSFVLENLGKPVILTGSQLPIGVIRTDGKENFLTAIEIAGAVKSNGEPRVPEVAIYFEYKLYRGNRTSKVSAENFDAFDSANFHLLAEAGVHIKYYDQYIRPLPKTPLIINPVMDNAVDVLYLFPGISDKVVERVVLAEDTKGIVMLSYGSGNAPTDDWFINLLEESIQSGKVIVNITQCITGHVVQGSV